MIGAILKFVFTLSTLRKGAIVSGICLIFTFAYLMTSPSRHRYVPQSLHLRFSSNTYKHNMTNNSKYHTTKFPSYIQDDEEAKLIAKDYPNFPIEFWWKVESEQNIMFLSNSSCAPFPDIYKLDIHNKYWQKISISHDTTIQVYSAYYDTRQLSGNIVRILSMVDKTKTSFYDSSLYCQLWFDEEDEPVIAYVDKLDFMWFEEWKTYVDGSFGPFLLGCSVPKSHQKKIPQVVSIVEFPCDKAKNMLRVVYEIPEKKEEFTVCVKGLDFLQIDLSFRLVEWIELVLLMGVKKIHMYLLEVHPNVKKVLDFYSTLNILDVREITLPGTHPNIPFVRHKFLLENNPIQCLDEIIPYNDCFYRNIHSHDYIGVFDIDEIILPLKDKNWHDLIQRTNSYFNGDDVHICSYVARHIYFLDKLQKEGPYQDIPSYMHMMQHVFRSQDFLKVGDKAKSIFNTNYTIAIHNHWPIAVTTGSRSVEFHIDDAQMRHYRKSCSHEINCTGYLKYNVKDTRLWDFKDIVVPRVNKALKEIGLI